MTIKDFALKYGVKYRMAFNASYGVTPHRTIDRLKDFDEKELMDSLINMLTEKRQKHMDAIDSIDNLRYSLMLHSQELS